MAVMADMLDRVSSESWQLSASSCLVEFVFSSWWIMLELVRLLIVEARDVSCNPKQIPVNN